MRSRRSFLGTMTGSVAAISALQGIVRADQRTKPPLGLQLWSLRAELERDLPGTLKQIKAWGIDEVEAAGFHGRSAAEFAGLLKGAGLRCQAMHVAWELLDKGMPGLLKDADALGATTLLAAYLPHDSKPSASREEILRAAAAFARWSTQCKAAGKRFAYHLHGQEFGPAPEGTLFDVLAKEAGPDVGFEIDVFWVTYGGADPVSLMKKHPGRFWYTHLKDMAKGVVPSEARGRPEANVVLGTGQIDVKGIVAAGPQADNLSAQIVNRVEKELILHVLADCDNVQTKAADRLGINRNTLRKKLEEYGLERP
jgi:sugar phosphate isomerase/epimerase